MRITLLSGALLAGCLVTGASAQEMAPVGIVQGHISLLMIRGSLGTLDLKSASGSVYQCNFDAQTLIERDHQRIAASSLRDNEHVELLADRKRGACYARIIRSIAAPAAVAARSRMRPVRAIENLYPRGNTTFAALVLRTAPSMIVVRTRAEAERIVLVGEGTRYLAGGHPSELSKLPPNTRVFIRGSRTFDNDFEAYQIVWGEIAGPKPRAAY
jgi:hypothetical protein